MLELKSASLDLDAISNGKWETVHHDKGQFEIFAIGLRSPDARKYHDKLKREAPSSDRTRGGQLTEEASFRILKMVLVEKCIKDWRGVVEKIDGGPPKPIQFEKDILRQLLDLPQWEVLASCIISAIGVIDNTTEKAEAEVAGNSPAS